MSVATSKDAVDASASAFKDKYGGGYGLQYPDGHVIRFYEALLRHELGVSGSGQEKLLDFGCGNGVHSQYFASKGFQVHGCDVVPRAIEEAHRRLPDCKENFRVIEPAGDVQGLFENKKFDVIFSNQVLYYLPDSKQAETVSKFERMLNDDGIVYFTMIGAPNYYYELSSPREDLDGLREVTLTGRLNETTYVGFTMNEDHLRKRFEPFRPYFVSYYDTPGREGSGHHFQYMGLKKGHSRLPA